MRRLKTGKRFHSRLNGVPRAKLISLAPPDTVALVPAADTFTKLKLLVKEKDAVSVGTPLFQDKHDPEVQFVSPGGGHVKAIVRGARRVVQEIVIQLTGAVEPADVFAPVSRETLDTLSRSELIFLLKQRGFWHLLRQFPFMTMPDARHRFPMTVVSLHSGNPFAPTPSLLLKDQAASFLYGLAVLGKISEKVVVATPEKFVSSLKAMGLADHITHVTADEYPAGDPGVILYQIKKRAADNAACTMDLQELIAMGSHLSTGRYQTERIYAVGGISHLSPAHYRTRMGSPVAHLTGEIAAGRGVITGGLFTGRLTSISAHMGVGSASAVVLDAADTDAFFGFVRPGRKLLSESRTFLSGVGSSTPLPMDATLHGEERACINCGWCDKKCPVDLMPQFIMKAVGAGDMEEVLSLGLLDCTGCGLCTFVCPSKIDLAAILALATEACYRERVIS